MKQAIKNKEKNVQPKNVVITNNIEVIYQVLNKSRLDLYSCLVEKNPSSLKEVDPISQSQLPGSRRGY